MSDQGTKEELNRVQLQRREEARQREAEKAATDKATEEAFQRYRNMVAAAEKRAEQALAQNHELQHSFEIHQSQMESARNAIALHQQQSREKDEQIEKLKKELDETSAREKALAEQLENTQKELEKQKRKWTQVLASIQSSE
ncbi:hypothetical protein Pelo_16418 [Pelomyxa schiedti]|nr:hypothetical protein Pelo_16418 [Pelomyxa schiedti]